MNGLCMEKHRDRDREIVEMKECACHAAAFHSCVCTIENGIKTEDWAVCNNKQSMNNIVAMTNSPKVVKKHRTRKIKVNINFTHPFMTITRLRDNWSRRIYINKLENKNDTLQFTVWTRSNEEKLNVCSFSCLAGFSTHMENPLVCTLYCICCVNFLCLRNVALIVIFRFSQYS